MQQYVHSSRACFAYKHHLQSKLQETNGASLHSTALSIMGMLHSTFGPFLCGFSIAGSKLVARFDFITKNSEISPSLLE